MLPFGTTLASRPRVAVKLAACAMLAIAAAPAKAQTPVAFGDTITEPGFYFLAGNQSGAGDGIVIDANDVTLLLSRFTLRGDGSGVGISTMSHSNVNIYGGRITNFKVGIELNSVEFCSVQGTRMHDLSSTGLILRRVDESSFLRIRCDNNRGSGVEAENVYDCRFVSVLSHDNGGHGISLANLLIGGGPSRGNKVKLCWLAYNELDGIHVLDSSYNELSRNQCVGNGRAGIRLDTNADGMEPGTILGLEGADENSVKSNWCVFNDRGIVVEWNSTGNTLTNNTALANGKDLVENNYESPCVNTWFLNFFLFKDGAGEDCIF